MTVAIPLKNQLDHTELLYCLRSIDKFLTGLPVAIISDNLPYWINNVTQINVRDNFDRKQLTIKIKVTAALEYDSKIIWIHDDVYLLKPYEPKFYIDGKLTKNNESGGRMLREQLENKTDYHYDIHCPVIYEKEKFTECVQYFTSDTIVKSMYGNYWNIPFDVLSDTKIDSKKSKQSIYQFISSLPAFSTGSQGLNSCLPVLQELFPEKSRFEI